MPRHYRREWLRAEEAKQAAIALVEAGMPAQIYGEVVTPADITFGRYDFATRTFTADDESREAFHVSTARLQTRRNAAASFLFRMIGHQGIREDVAVGTRGAVARIGADRGARAGLVQHLRDDHDAELVDRADLAVQDRAGIRVLVHGDEGLVAEGIGHRLDDRLELRALIKEAVLPSRCPTGEQHLIGLHYTSGSAAIPNYPLHIDA